jgi:ribonuclease HI
MGLQFVTIFADASFDLKTRSAGWGCWIIREKPAIVFGGPIPNYPANNVEAEIWAIALALQHAHMQNLIDDTVITMLQSDCTRALGLIKHYIEQSEFKPHQDGVDRLPNIRTRTDSEYAAVDEIRRVFYATKTHIQLRHVKGHSDFGGRSWVNAQCDRIARQHMQELRRSRANQPRGGE